jgi:hypothetical protein
MAVTSKSGRGCVYRDNRRVNREVCKRKSGRAAFTDTPDTRYILAVRDPFLADI